MSYDRNKASAVARGELGYHEKASNAQLDDKTSNAGSGNYTKYARDLDALGFFYNGKKQGFPYCDLGYDWTLVKAFGVEAALKLLCQPRYSAGAGCYYSAMYYKQKGQFHGPNTVPQPGDQIFFTYQAGEVSHTGMVENVSGNVITVIEFNTSDMVARRTYTVGESRIYGYGRPNWNMGAVADTSDGQTYTINAGNTYTVKSGETLSGIAAKYGTTYTALAAYNGISNPSKIYVGQKIKIPSNAYSTQASQPQASTALQYTVGASVEETIFNFCKEVLGLNTAAACGVLANIDEESKFKTGVIGDAGTSFGICQWHASRNAALRSWCAGNGKDYQALDGQLWYMKHELETTHAAVLKRLKAVADTAQGAYDAGYVWCSIFEVPADTVNKSEARGNLARSTYWPKYNGKASMADPAQSTVATGKTYRIELSELWEGMEDTATDHSVARAQTLLIAHGYTCGKKFYNGSEKADGSFGPITTEAVKKFQTDNAITVTGKIDAATMTALLK